MWGILRATLTGTAGADTGVGRRGPWPRPLVKVAQLNHIKSVPGRAHFTEKVPQLWHILQWSAETVSRMGQILLKKCLAKFIRAFCPTLSLGPSPLKIQYSPLHWNPIFLKKGSVPEKMLWVQPASIPVRCIDTNNRRSELSLTKQRVTEGERLKILHCFDISHSLLINERKTHSGTYNPR